MDGTLVDTEPYWMDAETDLVESFGGTWTHEQALQLVGNGLIDSAIILQGAGVEMGAQEIVDELTERVRVRLQQDGVPFRPGARELLRELREAASARLWSPCRCAAWRRHRVAHRFRRVRRDRRRR
jgi:beta-phosphoglucomutase-like phosphatase (HAD superfamily)